MCKISTLIALLLFPMAITAQPAIFVDGIFTIPQAAIPSNTGSSYFTNVQLADDGKGGLLVVGAEQRTLANVTDLSITTKNILSIGATQRFRVVTIVSETLLSCLSILTPAVSQRDQTFTIVVAESEPGSGFCQSTVGIIESTVDLDVTDLEAGTYTVIVNDKEILFDL